MHSSLKRGWRVKMDFISDNVIKCLKQEIDSYREKYAIALQEIKELNYFSKEDNDKLQAEVKRLKADVKHDADVCYDLDDKHIKIIEELKAELDKAENFRQCMYNDMDAEVRAEKVLNTANRQTITKLKAENVELKEGLSNEGVLMLQAEIKRLKEDNSKHYPKEYKQEAEEYFNNNPQAEKLFFFMVGGSGVDEDGDVIDTLNVGVDCIADCDNFKGVVSVETYT